MARANVATALMIGACAFLLTCASLPGVSSNAQSREQSIDGERSARQSELKLRLSSTRASEFRDALSKLTALDEPGALDVWQAALNNADARLQREAWRSYRAIEPELSRKQFIPQVTRIKASADEISRVAQSTGLEVTTWSASGNQTIAAAPLYLIDRLRAQSIEVTVLFDSVAAWQKARASGDAFAESITPEYQSIGAQSSMQIRIAVVDLAERTPPASGYSDWLADREDIVMRDGTRIAVRDIFPSDGSPASLSAHVVQQYTNRGYNLIGFYSEEEFARVAPRLFAGQTFNTSHAASGQVRIALANGKFHSYDQTVAEFKALESAHPDRARYVKLGSSYEGREIFALKISKDAGVDDASKPDVLITGCYHAREWISVESPVYFASRLVNDYASDDSVRYLLDHLQVWIVPIVNPDGLTYTQNSPEDPVVRLWRKNRRPISIGNCVSSVGVDLNRNYSYQWRTRDDTPCADYCSNDHSCLTDDVGASDDPRSEIYRGPEPESEPEVKALKTLLDDPNRHFRAQLDYHNYSQLVLYPWGYAPFGTDDAKMLSDISGRVSDAMFSVARMRYKPEQAIDLYATTGSSIDYSYAVNHVAAPFVVEMRPVCCDFGVPESEIPVINQENWAGAELLMNWAAGPPILESVKAYSRAPDGTFSMLVYSARWSASGENARGERTRIIEAHFPGLDPGPLQVRLQFSKTMNSSLPPRVTMGRGAVLNEVLFSSANETEGWQKTFYDRDTWIGETVVIQDEDLTTPWQLAVSAADPLGQLLDAVPATRADYPAGSGHWLNYEDSDGGGNEGGIDTQHVLAPGARGDYSSIQVASPGGGERLAAGETYRVVWIVPAQLGFVPVEQSLMFSIDGGVSYEAIASSLPLDFRRLDITVPAKPTTRGRIGLMVVEPVFRNFLIAPNQGDLTIGVNVGSAADISFLSSEKIDLNWNDASSDDPPQTASGSSRLTLNLKITNRGSVPILNPFLRVAELTRNVLLTRDTKSNWAGGARQTIDAGDDNILSPGETADARLVVGITKSKKFSLSVELYGVASAGTITPASAVNVWTGKPRTR